MAVPAITKEVTGSFSQPITQNLRGVIGIEMNWLSQPTPFVSVERFSAEVLESPAVKKG